MQRAQDGAPEPPLEGAVTPWGRLVARLQRFQQRDVASFLLLLAAVTLSIVVFGRLDMLQFTRFGTWGFDLGIYDQALWLLSRFDVPFVTIRGLHYFGHHVNVSSVLLVPFYWLGAGPRFLSVAGVVALAVGAVPLWLIARDRLRSPWPALVVGVTYLLFSTIEWNARYAFHPDVLAVAPLLFAWWFSLRRWWKAYAVAVALTLLAKEDAALVVAVLGILVAVRLDRRIGLATVTAAVGWFLIATKLVLPHFTHGLGPFYFDLYPGLGDNLLSIVGNAVRHPSRIIGPMTQPDRLTYYWQLLAPVAFLPVLSPVGLSVLAMALPLLVTNSVSGHVYTHDAMYYYSLLPVAVIMIGVIETVASLGRGRGTRWYLLGLVMVAAVVTNVLWSPSPVGRRFDTGIWAAANPGQATMLEAVRRVPPDASVSATYNLVTHLTHRPQVYEFPNPWVPTNWGVKGEGAPDPASVEYLVLSRALLGPETTLLAERLLGENGQFEALYDKGGVVVARRR